MILYHQGTRLARESSHSIWSTSYKLAISWVLVLARLVWYGPTSACIAGIKCREIICRRCGAYLCCMKYLLWIMSQLRNPTDHAADAVKISFCTLHKILLSFINLLYPHFYHFISHSDIEFIYLSLYCVVHQSALNTTNTTTRWQSQEKPRISYDYLNRVKLFLWPTQFKSWISIWTLKWW